MDFDLYDYGLYGSDMELFAGLAGLMLIILLIVLAVSLVLYILRSIGLMTIARNRNLPNPWIIWIPIVGGYTLGAIADDINEQKGTKSIYRWLLLGGGILSTAVSGGSTFSMFGSIMNEDYEGVLARSAVSQIGSLISLGVYVVSIMCLYYIFKCYKPDSATAYTVLCAIPFTAFLQSIFPFAIRNNQPVTMPNGPGGYGPYGQQPPPGWRPPDPSSFNQPPNGGGYQGQQGPYTPPPQNWQQPGNYQQPPVGQDYPQNQTGVGVDDGDNSSGPER